MPWIKIDTGMKNDPRIGAIADAVERDVAAVVGHLTCLLGELPLHARDGNLAGIPNSTLETWAMWTGQRGAFANAFREQMMAGDVVRSWEKYNGSSLRELDKKRADQKKRRDEQKAARDAERGTHVSPTNPERGPHGGGNVAPTVAPTTAPTFPDRGALTVTATATETVSFQDNHQNNGGAASPPPPLLPFTVEVVERRAAARPTDAPLWLELHAEWERRVGPVPKGRFCKAFKPVCEGPEGAPLDTLPMLRRAIEWYAAIRKGTREWEFVGPERFVGGIRDHLRIAHMPVEERMQLLPLRVAS